MSRRTLALLYLYLTAAAGYGGWRGPDLWSDWGVWCILIPPFAVSLVQAVGQWRRNPYRGTIVMCVAMIVCAVVAVGGPALFLAWGMADFTARWWAVPAVRALIASGSTAALCVFALVAGGSKSPAEPRGTPESENPDSPSEPGATPNRGIG